MNMAREKILTQLNRLIKINQDRIEGYKAAHQDVEDSYLKALFSRLKITSEECKHELETEVSRLGGIPEEGISAFGKFYRAWKDIKIALAAKDRLAILNACEFNEEKVIETYEEILKEHHTIFTASEVTMIRAHLELMMGDHDEIRTLQYLSPETA